MAAGPALEMWSKQTGTAESPDGKQRIVTMVRGFTITLAANDRLEVAYSAANLPLVNELYPGTSFVILRKLTPSRISPILVLMVAEYSGEIGPGDISSSPIDNDVIVTWRNATVEEAIDQDFDGNPIVTVNGEPIEGVSERISDQVATIERNFLAINIPAISAYLRSTNSDTFLGFPAGTGRLMDYTATNIIQDGVAGFWKVTAVMQFREPYNTTPDKAWYKRLRHEGYLVRNTPGGKIFNATVEGNKTPATKPILLAEDGTRLPIPADATTVAAHWLEFRTLASLPYNALGLL
jgi:hypothetical protein